MKKINTRQGFTLIELLVVVLIIGILSAIALPQYNKAVIKAQAVELVSFLNATEKAMDLWMLQNGYKNAGATDWDIQITPSENLNKNYTMDGVNCFDVDPEYPDEPAECWISINARGNARYDNDILWENINHTWFRSCRAWNDAGFTICSYLKQTFPDMTVTDSR